MNKKRPSHFFYAAVLWTVLFLFQAVSAYCDSDVSFFRLQDNWSERFKYKGTRVVSGEKGVGFLEDAPDQVQYKGAGSRYFKEPDAEEDLKEQLFQPPAPFSLELQQLQGTRETIEIEIDQVGELRGDGIKRHVSTNEERIDFYLVNSQTLQIKGAKLGNTFIHIWDNNGRVTIPVRVIPRQTLKAFNEQRIVEAGESESFKIEYSETRSAFYTGQDFEDLSRTSLNYDQNFRVTGETPYGYIVGDGSLRRGTTKTELSSVSLLLRDGKVGPFSDFDLTVGDSRVQPGMYVLPSARIRGVYLDHAKSKSSGRTRMFFGRQLSSLFGTLLSTQQETTDAFVGGFYHDFKPVEWALWQVGYFYAYGQDRSDDLNKHGIEIRQEYRLGESMKLSSNLGYNEEVTAWDVNLDFNFGEWRGRAAYRDVAEQFFSLVGSGAGRGEQSFSFDVSMPTWVEGLSMDYDMRLHRDRLSFFEQEHDRFNLSQKLTGAYRVNETGSLTFKVEDEEETALASPIRTETYEVGYRDRAKLWEHPFSYYLRLNHQDSETITSPDAFYRRQQLVVGFNTPVIWGFDFSYAHSIAILNETNNRTLSHPRQITYSLTRRERLPNTPISTDISFRYVDEEETEALRSFLTGEDRLEISGRISYEIENIELYVEGRYDSFNPENSNSEYTNEAEVITGVRYLYDTGRRWEPSMVLAGQVFEDLNNDGFRQDNEAPMKGIVLLSGGQKVVTDENGKYDFGALSGNTVTVAVDTTSLPYGYAGSSSLIRKIANDGTSQQIDFGLVAISTITGLVYNDLNTNGQFDRGEPGVEGVKVVVDKGKYATRSRADGAFRFSNIEVGEHVLTLDIRSLDLGYLPFKNFRQNITLRKGSRIKLDFPVIAQRTISGRVFEDVNRNGHLDIKDRIVAGAKVLFGDISIESDAEGYYLIENVPVGIRSLTVHPNTIGNLTTDFSKEFNFDPGPRQVQIDIPLTNPENNVK